METPKHFNTSNSRPAQTLPTSFQADLLQRELTVQQTLRQWYGFLKAKDGDSKNEERLFQAEWVDSLLIYLERIPELLMEELIQHGIADKTQYVRLVQALLINLSDRLPVSEKQELLHSEVEHVLEFMQHFFFPLFDMDYRVSQYSLKYLQDRFRLKLDYWNIKLQQSPLIDVLQDCIDDHPIWPEQFLTFRQLSYLKNIFRQIESSTSIIHENFIRELLLTYNFNTGAFAAYEIGLIKTQLTNDISADERIALLQREDLRIEQFKMKSNTGYNITLPSLKEQLHQWIAERIQAEEQATLRKTDQDLQIEHESKIQTSFSVSKLAVLIRVLVADRIIINKTIAPMLRTVSKLFTTLQKDEISYGSLETKYHAPDKATIAMMKELLQKWVALVEKL